MPVFLLHGFRWTRINIRILVILNDIEDAASEWIMAPATSKALLDNFYKKYDFLPSCRPPLPTCQQAIKISSNVISEEKLAKDLDLPCTLRSNNSRKTLPCESTLSLNMDPPIHFNDWSPIKLVEQYDPDEQFVCSQPYAYVADYLVKVDLSVALDEQIQKYENFRAEQCRDLEEKQNAGSSAHELEKHWLERLRNELEKESDIGWYVVYCGDQEREIPALSDEDPSFVASPKTPWNASFKSLFKGRRSDAEKLS
ncbi:hypothetical protein EPUL_004520 [Erysiphe pulchra]|uniref:Uncharacterized protein n=1 Tax=Erysiphe pulchra TaxID=225359 RepID=A0A2S4Q138_9PEZI|nr:hypothetical protein EPUL_004520 [Erysiphe pulchra]